ncbi:MAG: energy-coupling factor ABC transporter permease [Clostridiales Family XIII bacterium]|jgi:cobalt/nickel transport system permease protein|nr:energy-coupling factor ABC transporter permease [Clostridiales Family XIII bacterium]
MADALLTPAVGGAMAAVSVAAIAYSAAKIKKEDFTNSKVPLMAVSGAMVFAAQMINFTIPGTGSSGHIGGGILLAALLGPWAGLLALAAVLIIQCLCFADGGLLALGCNIFNMGVIPCLFIYPLLFRPIFSRTPSPKRSSAASIVSVIIALQLGAFAVVSETAASGIVQLPFSAFLLLMQPIHLAIGIVEGIVTAAILVFVHNARPEILTAAAAYGKTQAAADGKPRSARKVILVFAVIAAACGIGLSLLASSYPDGLEWSIAGVTGAPELAAQGAAADALAAIQERFSFMPDYDFAAGDGTGTSVASIVGAILVFAAAGGAALLIRFAKKSKRAKAQS